MLKQLQSENDTLEGDSSGRYRFPKIGDFYANTVTKFLIFYGDTVILPSKVY